jgi:uncharacterized protein YdeI (YjbR/CyaY-like superfamily)
MKPVFFESGDDFRAWLGRHHAGKTELLLGFYATKSGKSGITYQQALDHALCYGWIDGVRKNFDATSYTIRFTPRKAKSHWSQVNLKRWRELEAQGLTKPPGAAAHERRHAVRTIRYSYELRAATLPPAFIRTFKANRKAWAFFEAQAPSYQRHARFWVTNAKKEETRDRRFKLLLESSADARRLDALSSNKKR